LTLKRIRAGARLLGPIAICCVWPSAASAAEPTVIEDMKGPSQWEVLANLLYVIVILAVVIGLIIVLIKFLSKNSQRFYAAKGLRLMAGIQLGQNKSLQVVEVGRRIYLLGVGENIQLIDKIDDEQEADAIRQMLAANDTAGGEGWRKLLSLLNRRREPQKSESFEATESFQEIFYRQMNRVSESKKQQLEDWERQADRTEER